MSDLVFLASAPMRCIGPFFPRSRGHTRVDDRRVVSGIVFSIRYGRQWKDVSPGYDGNRFRAALTERGIPPCIPST